jgi:tripartite-type tricarboxylate transporter receptor subunit TctC
MPKPMAAGRRALLRGLAAGATLALPTGAGAQGEWPSRQIRFVVPFAPGGASDATARVTAQHVSTRIGRPVVVDNRAGAASTLGTAEAARATDGHTILLAPPPFVITQFAYPNLPYDPVRDFVPVALLVTSPILLYARKGFPTRFAEIQAWARANPGKITYGTPGNGSLPHVAFELLKLRSGLDALHVPYRGGGPAAADLAAGRIDLMLASPLDVAGQVQGGLVVPVAVAGPQRLTSLPDVPTLAEAGVRDYEVAGWFGVMAPSSMPADAVQRLNKEFNAALALPEVRSRLSDLGADPAGGTPEAFGALLQAERARWSEAVRAANLRFE